MGKSIILNLILYVVRATTICMTSRENFQKQFMSLVQLGKKLLNQKKYARIKNLKNLNNPISICNKELRLKTTTQIKIIQVRPNSILYGYLNRKTHKIALLAYKA